MDICNQWCDGRDQSGTIFKNHYICIFIHVLSLIFAIIKSVFLCALNIVTSV